MNNISIAYYKWSAILDIWKLVIELLTFPSGDVIFYIVVIGVSIPDVVF